MCVCIVVNFFLTSSSVTPSAKGFVEGTTPIKDVNGKGETFVCETFRLFSSTVNKMNSMSNEAGSEIKIDIKIIFCAVAKTTFCSPNENVLKALKNAYRCLKGKILAN